MTEKKVEKWLKSSDFCIKIYFKLRVMYFCDVADYWNTESKR